MAKNLIVSEETVRDLLEAHATLSAWYYQLWAGLRAAGLTVPSPDEAARASFVERLAIDFPEVSSVTKGMGVPRMFVPAPPAYVASEDDVPTEEQATLVEPAAARQRNLSRDSDPGSVRRPATAIPPAAGADAAVAPPPMVNPSKVKYSP